MTISSIRQKLGQFLRNVLSMSTEPNTKFIGKSDSVFKIFLLLSISTVLLPKKGKIVVQAMPKKCRRLARKEKFTRRLVPRNLDTHRAPEEPDVPEALEEDDGLMQPRGLLAFLPRMQHSVVAILVILLSILSKFANVQVRELFEQWFREQEEKKYNDG